MDNVRIVFVSLPREEARDMARTLVEERLAACANIIPKMESFYWWEGKIENDEEALLMIKTSYLKVEDLIRYMQENHPYEVPDIISVPIMEGLPDYINWMLEETGRVD
jgi:periplasmic divalent cation tolerance protein